MAALFALCTAMAWARTPASIEPGQASSAATPDSYETLARTVVSDLAARRFGAVEARYTAEMTAALPAGKLASLWDQVLGGTGAFQSIQSVKMSDVQGYHAATVTCSFEKQAVGIRVVLDAGSHLAGLSFVPPEPAPQASGSAPSSAQATAQTARALKSPADVEAAARAVMASLAARDFDKVESFYSEPMKQALPHGKLAQGWDGENSLAGAYHSVRSAQVSESGEKQVAKLECEFGSNTVVATVSFDADGKLVGLLLGMPQSNTPWAPPDYAHPESFSEQPVSVGQDPTKLTGTLTLPKKPGPFPAVVLVQGSGATDQDESVGPNKPFRDLAWGLASAGVAVLRYNKRTFQYPKSFTGQFTVEQESVEDAKSAVAMLAARSDIDPKRIFVAGHSLGAMLAPRIAKEQPLVAGIVVMAGNTRPLEDLVIEQVKYQVGLAGTSTPAGDKAIADAEKSAVAIRNPALKPDDMVDLLGSKVPGSYFLDLRTYDPARTAAGLSIPIFVLQGARDCQVRMADYEGWKRALADKSTARFALYPDLYHLFIPVPASDTSTLSTAADYMVAGHVATAVVADIAGWVAAPRAAAETK